ncbi:phosphatase PAP2 family protein [Nafulsella turpanensis]|uniref:phosphatase PAP2 family protein n=1 Tax=Nafulsella turpanensis TaxID=1265690 RepID=UPI00034A20C0|nr:phosphatase PAP2 family protein [Nafulsella turpanensis]
MKNIQLIVYFWIMLAGMAHPLAAQENFAADSIQTPEESFQEPVLDPGPVFEFSLKKDLPILAGSGLAAAGGYLLMESVDPLTEAQIAALDPADVNAFDRGATRQYRDSDARLSDILLTASAIAPFSVLASRSVRQEFGPVLIMYAETAAMIGGLTSISKGLFMRKRPYSYNPNVPLGDKLTLDARHSFFSGHVSTSAAFSFLTAYMVDRYAERPAWKWVAWSGAVLIPGTIGYWRYTSGNHFPSDILVGFVMGAGTGLLIPHLHRYQLPDDVALNIQPLPGGMRLTLNF